jgi:exopolysaccharide biosynthesis polyprenyl glycosylphosphotransferase
MNTSVRKRYAYRITKRFFDVVLSVIGLIVLSPVFLITAIAIKLEDGGPVFFSQMRSGLNEKPFRMYKFRSMCTDAAEKHKEMLKYNEQDGPAFKMKNDPRVTKVGRFIRKTSIDELPQLVNIVKGDMSIVGPRPLPVYETEKCNDYQKQRLQVKPGLTCYWQVSGRNNLSFSEWMEMDIKYINEAGMLTDMIVFFRTFKAVITGEGA